MMRYQIVTSLVALLSSILFVNPGCQATPAQIGHQPVSAQTTPLQLSEAHRLLDQLKRNPQTTPAQINAAERGLADIRTLHRGMSRSALLKVLHEEGGVSTANVRQYVVMLGPGKDGRYGPCLKVTITFVSQRNYAPWLRKHAEWMKSRPIVLQDTNLYLGFNSAVESPDDIVINLSEPSLGYFTID